MVVVLCSVCGEPAEAGAEACSVCHAHDQRAVRATLVPETPRERLLANIKRTIASLVDLRSSRLEELHGGTRANRKRALKVRLEAQAAVLKSRLRGDREGRDSAAYRDALARAEAELQASL